MTDTFQEDFYAHNWMEWRSSIETGELSTHVAAIPEPERRLAAKYKAMVASASASASAASASAHENSNPSVLYAVAFVLGRHVDYVKAIWRTLVCNGVWAW